MNQCPSIHVLIHLSSPGSTACRSLSQLFIIFFHDLQVNKWNALFKTRSPLYRCSPLGGVESRPLARDLKLSGFDTHAKKPPSVRMNDLCCGTCPSSAPDHDCLLAHDDKRTCPKPQHGGTVAQIWDRTWKALRPSAKLRLCPSLSHIDGQ